MLRRLASRASESQNGGGPAALHLLPLSPCRGLHHSIQHAYGHVVTPATQLITPRFDVPCLDFAAARQILQAKKDLSDLLNSVGLALIEAGKHTTTRALYYEAMQLIKRAHMILPLVCPVSLHPMNHILSDLLRVWLLRRTD